MERKIGRLVLTSSLNEEPNLDNFSKYSWEISSDKGNITIWQKDLNFLAVQAFWSGTEEQILDNIDTILSNLQYEAYLIERFILSHQ